MFDPNVHVGVAVIYSHFATGHSLCIKRSATVSHGQGKWSVPGGWIDSGETPEQACIREFKEEVGITIREIDLSLSEAVSNSYPEVGTVICLVYEILLRDVEPGRIMEADKIDALKWMNLWEMQNREDLFDPLVTYMEKIA